MENLCHHITLRWMGRIVFTGSGTRVATYDAAYGFLVDHFAGRAFRDLVAKFTFDAMSKALDADGALSVSYRDETGAVEIEIVYRP